MADMVSCLVTHGRYGVMPKTPAEGVRRKTIKGKGRDNLLKEAGKGV